MQTLPIHEVLVKRKEAADQFFAGLETLGILSLVRSNTQLMKSYFVASQDIVHTSNCILAYLTAIHEQFDCEQKERARLFFIPAAHELEVGIKSSILTFFVCIFIFCTLTSLTFYFACLHMMLDSCASQNEAVAHKD